MTDAETVVRVTEQCTYELGLLNKLFDAQNEYRRLSDAVGNTQPGTADRAIANRKAIDKLAVVIQLQRELEEVTV